MRHARACSCDFPAQVMEMVRGTTEVKLMEKTERNLHDFAVNVRALLPCTAAP